MSHVYTILDVSPDMSVSLTGRSEGQNRDCKPGSRASEAVKSCSGSIRQDRTLRSPGHYVVECAYHKHHPVLQYLQTKLAEWIGENMQEDLGFHDREDPNKRIVSELNDILLRHVERDRNGCVSLVYTIPAGR